MFTGSSFNGNCYRKNTQTINDKNLMDFFYNVVADVFTLPLDDLLL